MRERRLRREPQVTAGRDRTAAAAGQQDRQVLVVVPVAVVDAAAVDDRRMVEQRAIRLMCDLLVVAFQADVTRVATFVLANEGSNKPYPFIGVPEGHHDLSHHGGNPDKQAKIRTINLFHARNVAHLLERLDATQEAN
ncbi:MAG: DUF1552 domain-containing protein, partial [Planctomycetia bacterium]